MDGFGVSIRNTDKSGSLRFVKFLTFIQFKLYHSAVKKSIPKSTIYNIGK